MTSTGRQNMFGEWEHVELCPKCQGELFFYVAADNEFEPPEDWEMTQCENCGYEPTVEECVNG